MFIHSTRIVHDNHELLPHNGKGQGVSIGAAIDRVINLAIESGQELGKIELIYDEQEWRDIVALYQPTHATNSPFAAHGAMLRARSDNPIDAE